MIVDYEVDASKTKIILKTNLELSIPLDKEHKLELKRVGDENIPFIDVRDGIKGFLSRSVYYSLVDIAISQENDSSGELILKKLQLYVQFRRRSLMHINLCHQLSIH